MAEEEIIAPAAASPGSSSDNKRKFEDLEPEAPQPTVPTHHTEPDAVDNVAASDSSEAKRPRLDDKPDGLASENGFQAEKSDEPVKDEEDGDDEDPEEQPYEENKQKEDTEPPSEELQVKSEQPDDTQQVSVEDPEDNTPQDSVENPDANTQQVTVENSEADDAQEPSKDEITQFSEDIPQGTHGIMTRKLEVPNNKVGVLIGKAGDTIRYLQYNSGAKIQITRDAEADPHATTRPVEIIGDLSNIEKAEMLIKAVIAEADAGGSPSLVARGLATAQAAGASEQIEIQVPNEKVGLIIGKGGETIKGLQTRTGARIQLIPQHLPEGDGSKERTVRISGDKKQIEMARVMIKDVMNQTVKPSSLSSGLNQQAYRPRGPTGPGQWGPRGPHSAQPMSYDFHQRGPYSSQNQQYQPPNYGSYPPQQMAPRSNFGSGWEHRPPPSMQGQSGGYDYYGGQGGHVSDHAVSAPLTTPIPGHAPGPSPVSAMGPPQSQANYNYGQPQGTDYGHPAPYSQTAPTQQGYGHGYDEQKYDNHAPTQHPYGGHGNSQPVYPQAGTQPGYAPQQQYGKPPSYGMPPQGPPTQSYGPSRASQPGEVPYQGPISSAQSYGSNVPAQQYPYVSTGSIQQTYPPYGSAPATDGYTQLMPASGPGYTQQGGQPVPGYGQPGGQQAPAYGQVGPTGGYGAYPSAQQGYVEQPASTGYGYQAPQDPAYSSGPGSAYGAPPSGQPNYTQPAPTQPSYDQSALQSGGYGAAPASAPVGYGKTVSPQPAYPQYDSTQMYAAPR